VLFRGGRRDVEAGFEVEVEGAGVLDEEPEASASGEGVDVSMSAFSVSCTTSMVNNVLSTDPVSDSGTLEKIQVCLGDSKSAANQDRLRMSKIGSNCI
jgi:hypothetical protein